MKINRMLPPKYMHFLILVIISLLFNFGNKGFALEKDSETLFPNTRLETTILQTYHPEKVKGQKVITTYTFPNRPYYVYTGLDVSTRINLPYAIKEEPSNPAADILRLDYKIGESYFYIKPIIKGIEGSRTNIHVVCENGFSLLINIHITQSRNANQLVTFLDGQAELEKEKYTKEFFDQITGGLQDTIDKKNRIIRQLFFNPISKFGLNETIRSGMASITLKNMASVNGIYFYNFMINSESLPLFNEKNIVLEIKNIKHILFSERFDDKEVYTPAFILIYPDDGGKRQVTVSFKISHPSALFHSNLRIGHSLFFTNKVNFELDRLNYNILDITF